MWTDYAFLHFGDCLEALATLPENSIDSIVTDPPYHLTQASRNGSPRKNDPKSPFGRHHIGEKGFMGKTWDGGDIAFRPETWNQILRVTKPGAHLLAFGGTRTFHRLMCAIEDAGWEIRDTIMWVYGSGFPKSKNLDGEREGWGTALKPGWEPIVIARKALEGTVAANVLKHGTGAINVDGCRIPVTDADYAKNCSGDRGHEDNRTRDMEFGMGCGKASDLGRWPANLVHDGSEEVLAGFPETKSGTLTPEMNVKASSGWSGGSQANRVKSTFQANVGSAARFFYCAKASKQDRGEGNTHPTVKPQALMRWLVRLVTPPGGVVLDPFMGSGTTGVAAMLEKFDFMGIEKEDEAFRVSEKRIERAFSSGQENQKNANTETNAAPLGLLEGEEENVST